MLQTLEMLTSGTEEERQELMSICVQILTNYPMTDLVTPIFVFEQLCSIIHPVSIYPSICLSIHSSIYLSIYLFIPCINPFICSIFICVSFSLSRKRKMLVNFISNLIKILNKKSFYKVVCKGTPIAVETLD